MRGAPAAERTLQQQLQRPDRGSEGCAKGSQLDIDRGGASECGGQGVEVRKVGGEGLIRWGRGIRDSVYSKPTNEV